MLAECLRYVHRRGPRGDPPGPAGALLHQLCAIARDFEHRGVHLIVLDQQLDTSTPSGELHFHLLGAIAQFDQRLRKQRQLEGIAAAHARGVRFGRQKRLTPAQVHTLQQERARGDLIRELMARYGLKKASIYRYLAQARLVAAEAADREESSMLTLKEGQYILGAWF